MAKNRLAENPVHLGLGATAVAEPHFSGDVSWYEAYGKRHADDGNEARLVSMHTFSADWPVWEVHPEGSEVVVCLEGSMTLYQELAGEHTEAITLRPGEYAINDPGVWHTADVDGHARALFITAGRGTEHRER